MKIKAILFDLDGTLVELCETHYEALNMALKEVINYEINLDLHLKYFNGKTTNTKLNILENMGLLEEKDKRRIWLLKQQYTEKCIYNFKEDEQKIDLMIKLKELNYKLVCVSNSIINTVNLILDKIGILKYFGLTLGNEMFGNKTKPDPYPYLLAFEKLNLLPNECLIIEDNFNGIISAKNSKGNLLEVKNSTFTTFENIINKIKEIEDE